MGRRRLSNPAAIRLLLERERVHTIDVGASKLLGVGTAVRRSIMGTQRRIIVQVKDVPTRGIDQVVEDLIAKGMSVESVNRNLNMINGSLDEAAAASLDDITDVERVFSDEGVNRPL